CANNNAGMFVTYLFAVVDLVNGEVVYCNAGHDPFYLLQADGRVLSPCERHGIPLGVKNDYHYKQGKIQLKPGETLFLYTDGIPE
ncbi:MAG: PP2C family protein-serine/threonine phosphatase, partial [Victivallaceae bacterium]